MLKHYFKFAIRNFRSNKTIFAGSLATLCLGALCISLLFSYVWNELTMDEFHDNIEDIYMITMKPSPESDWSFPHKSDYSDYPEVINCTALTNFRKEEIKIKYNNFTYTPLGMAVDSSFFKVFNFKLTIGNENTILNDYDAIILSEDFSRKLFGDGNPIGKKVGFEDVMYQGNPIVKGIIKIPSNSSFKFDFLIPKGNIDFSRMGLPFVQLKKGSSKKDFDEKIKDLNNNLPNFFPQLTESIIKTVNLKDLYFSNDFNQIKDLPEFNSGNRDNIDILIIIIIIILVVSILNFSNLQIVNVNSVIKNTAISKINGALKKNIIYQKIVENIIVIMISALIITILFNVSIPYFNAFMKVNLTPPLWEILLINILFVIIMVSIGLIYPMVSANRFSGIISINKQQQLKGKKLIVVVQYMLTFILLISSIIVAKQLQLMLSKDLGFNTQDIMKVKLLYEPPYNPESRNWSEAERDAYRKEYLKKPQHINNQLASFASIKKFTQGSSPLNVYPKDWKLETDDNSEFRNINMLNVSPDYFDVFDFKIVEGRFFDKNIDGKTSPKIVINESAKLSLGITDIEKTKMDTKVWFAKPEGVEIMGVIEDFNYEHLSAKPAPLFLSYSENFAADYFIKLEKNRIDEGIAQIQKLFNEVNPNQTFMYSFLSDDIAALYDKEKRLSIIYIIFTIIALLISAIGLFTIALYDTQRRIKEIGVRKVNGATIKDILIMLNKDFIKWVFVAFVIACPIAYYAMSKWLENFAYKTSLNWWVFVLAGIFTLIIALLTVSWQSYKAATQNPVDSLRDE